MNRVIALGAVLAALGLAACNGQEPTEAPPEEPVLKADKGVDLETQTITIGALNDESGPAAAISKPFAVGKRVLAASINAGGTGLLPEGWKVELAERDHAYNPTNAVSAYNEIQDQILFIGTSFGTPNTLPLRPMLERDGVAAFPASLSSEMAAHLYTPPIGPSYELEAMRAMDWVVQTAGDPAAVKAGIVYQQDDYGADGLAGWKAAAAHHGVTIVSEETISPGQKDFTAVITGLKEAGADYVMLTTLPSATGPIVGTAAQLQYMPTWIGNTPAWIDRFFDPEVIPSAVFGNYHQMYGLPYWGEDLPGMAEFLAAYEAHGKELGDPDFYILVSYIQGLVQIEAARRAIEAGDITRAGYMTALRSVHEWDAGGLIQPLSLKDHPYVTGTRTRVLKPDFENKTWTTVADWAEAEAAGAEAAPDEGAQDVAAPEGGAEPAEGAGEGE